MPPTPLILFPGMGADARLFAAQQAAFPQLVVPPWLEPLPSESLAHYAERFARHVDPGVPCFVGGASLGGFIAIEAARHLRAKACFLIGSIKGPGELPRRVRRLRRLKRWLPWIPFEWTSFLIDAGLVLTGPLMTSSTRSLFLQLSDADARFLRWASGAVLMWAPPQPPGVPVFHIHGRRDKVLPVRHTKPDVIIEDAGHIPSLSHADEVNRFLRENIERVEAQAPAPPAEVLK